MVSSRSAIPIHDWNRIDFTNDYNILFEMVCVCTESYLLLFSNANRLCGNLQQLFEIVLGSLFRLDSSVTVSVAVWFISKYKNMIYRGTRFERKAIHSHTFVFWDFDIVINQTCGFIDLCEYGCECLWLCVHDSSKDDCWCFLSFSNLLIALYEKKKNCS